MLLLMQPLQSQGQHLQARHSCLVPWRCQMLCQLHRPRQCSCHQANLPARVVPPLQVMWHHRAS